MFYLLFGLLGAGLLALDQWFKAWTVANLALWETAPFLPGVVELMRVHNFGAAWSSFSGQRWLLMGVTAVLLAAVTYVLARRIVRHPVGILAACLVISGGVGNLMDRARLGFVVDMFHFQFWPSYPVFNIADICIVCGAVLGALYYLFLYEPYDKPKKGDSDGTADTASENG